jgi:hypothetical protein
MLYPTVLRCSTVFQPIITVYAYIVKVSHDHMLLVRICNNLMYMRYHVTNHFITSNDKDSNSENRIKLRVRDSPGGPPPPGGPLGGFPPLPLLPDALLPKPRKIGVVVGACVPANIRGCSRCAGPCHGLCSHCQTVMLLVFGGTLGMPFC